MDWPLLGDACRIGSTPASKVMAVTPEVCGSDVATIMTASPFRKSARAAAGTRLSAC